MNEFKYEIGKERDSLISENFLTYDIYSHNVKKVNRRSTEG